MIQLLHTRLILSIAFERLNESKVCPVNAHYFNTVIFDYLQLYSVFTILFIKMNMVYHKNDLLLSPL